MPEPQRGLIIEEVHAGGATLPADTHVWILADPEHPPAPDTVEVEHKGRFLAVPARSVLPSPVPRPPLERLRQLDACFGLGDEAFDILEDNDGDYYRGLRCRAHGRLFLEDTRGGIAMYTRLILVDARFGDDIRRAWRSYHSMSDDMLNHMEIAR